MPRPVYITASSTGTLGPVNLDYGAKPFTATIGVMFNSSTMTATYGVQYTVQDQQQLTIINSTLPITGVDDVNLPTGTTSGNLTTNYISPVMAVRCVISAISSGIITFCVTQGGP